MSKPAADVATIARMRAAEAACRAAAQLVNAMSQIDVSTESTEEAERLGELVDRLGRDLEAWARVKRNAKGAT